MVKLFKENFFRPQTHVVCTLTGRGLKDSDTVFRVAGEPKKVDAAVNAIGKALEGIL